MAGDLGIVFNGESAKECDDFIHAVRKYARAKGKNRDNAWIADEVYDAFSGKALRWLLDQPPKVQKDWALLQKALLDYGVDNNGDNGFDQGRLSGENSRSAPTGGFIPTPAAATSRRNDIDLSEKVRRLGIHTGLRRFWKQTPEVQRGWGIVQKPTAEGWSDDGQDDNGDYIRGFGETLPPVPPSTRGFLPTLAAAVSSPNSRKSLVKVGHLKIRTGLLHTSDKFLSNATYMNNTSDNWNQGSFALTSDAKAAMRVKLIPSDNGLYQLEIVDHLAEWKFVAGYFLISGLDCRGFLMGVDLPSGSSLQDQKTTYLGPFRDQPFRTAIWRLEANRYLSLVWPLNENDKEGTSAFIYWKPEDGIVLSWGHPFDATHKQVEFEFEVIKD